MITSGDHGTDMASTELCIGLWLKKNSREEAITSDIRLQTADQQTRDSRHELGKSKAIWTFATQ